MSKRQPSDPRSPVQQGGSSGAIPILLLAVISALLFWGWQQDWAGDAGSDEKVIRAPGKERLQAPSSASPPTQRARANLAAYFTDDDYPQDAIRKEEQGTVAFRLIIAPDGRVTDCQIDSSSGSSALDAATCRILRSRARFAPARDSGGSAVADEMSGRIKWVLPAG